MVSLLSGILRRHSGKTSAKTPRQNTAWWLFERSLRVLAAATIFAAVARHLGPNGFAELNYAVSLVLTLAALASLGLDTVIVQTMVRRPDAAAALLGSAAMLRLVAGSLGFLLLVLGTTVIPQHVGASGLVLIIGLLLLLQPLEVAELWFQRQSEAQRVVGARLVMLIVAATVRIGLIVLDAPLPWFAAAVLLDHLLYTGTLAVLYWRSHDAPRWQLASTEIRTLLRQALPLGAAMTFSVLQFRLEYLIAGRFLPADSAGHYFAALRLTELWLPIGTAVAAALLPWWSEHRVATKERSEIDPIAFDVLAATGWMVALGSTLTLPWALSLVLGLDYAPAASLAVVKACTAPLLFTALARVQWLTLGGSLLAQAFLNALGALTLFGIAWVLVPPFGAMGLAFAAAVTALVVGPIASSVLPPTRSCARAHWRSLAILLAPLRLRATWARFQ